MKANKKSLAQLYHIDENSYENTPISYLNFSTRTTNYLITNEINDISSLLLLSPEVLSSLKDFGNTCLDEIKKFCKKLGNKEKERKNSGKSLAQLYHIDENSYENTPISYLNFSTRTTNCLISNEINDISSLLAISPKILFSIKGFGNTCLDEIEKFCKKLGNKNEKIEKIEKIFVEHALNIAHGDFSFVDEYTLTYEEKQQLKKFKLSYEILGEDLASLCIKKDSNILSFLEQLKNFSRIAKYHFRIHELLKIFPDYRKYSKAEPYINTYTLNEQLRDNLKKILKDKNTTIFEMVYSINFDDETAHENLCYFLEWCNFDIKLDIEELFSLLYKNEREKEIIKYRAMGQTLEEVGNVLGVTRERIRQIEIKIKERFSNLYKKLDIVSKISLEINKDGIVTLLDVEKYSKENTQVFLFLLKNYEDSKYIYDKELDIFIIENDSIKYQVERYIEELPEIISRDKVSEIIKNAVNEKNISKEIIEKFFFDTYSFTGNVYHKSRLSLASIYREIINKYYSNGLKIYDSMELINFRKLVKKEYGEIDLSENDRALSARIADICILCGRGEYKLKQEKYISKELERKIFKYITEDENKIFMMNTLFSLFERELIEEGITNKYYLQGILKELFSNKFTLTRDYISKDSSITSIYSSILNYIKTSQYLVTKEQIQMKFPGVTDIVINLSLTDGNILNYFGEYLHSSNLKIWDDEKDYLYILLSNILDDKKPHHNKEIYEIVNNEKPELLTRNSIFIQFSLFSVLEYLFKGDFQFSRPYIAKKGIKIYKAMDKLKNLIYSKNEFFISDIRTLAKENYLQLSSVIEFINSCNDEFLLINNKIIKRISLTGLNEEIAVEVENIIEIFVSETMIIRDLPIWNKLPEIIIPWTEWLVYSVIKKWGKKFEVSMTSNQFRFSIPLIAPIGKMDISNFENIIIDNEEYINKIDDFDNIDDILEDIIDDDFLMGDI